MSDLEGYLKDVIRDVPDFPKPGILFKDITPVLQNAQALARTIDAFKERLQDVEFDEIVGIESRGFIFGTALAYAMNKGIVLVRKPGKLPAATDSVTYELEYGTDSLEIHLDALDKGQTVVVIDDLLATGGTAAATKKLVEQRGASIAAFGFVIELDFLKGRNKLGDADIISLVTY